MQMAGGHGLSDGWRAVLLASDGVIAFSYFLIPGMLGLFLRRRWADFALGLRLALGLFVAFILCCGAEPPLTGPPPQTHASAILVESFGPRFEFMVLTAVLKTGTAVVSALTAALLFVFVPLLLDVPLELQREKRHRAQLEALCRSRLEVEEELRRQLERRDVLRRITNAVRGTLEAEGVFATAAREIGRAFHADLCTVWVREEADEEGAGAEAGEPEGAPAPGGVRCAATFRPDVEAGAGPEEKAGAGAPYAVVDVDDAEAEGGEEAGAGGGRGSGECGAGRVSGPGPGRRRRPSLGEAAWIQEALLADAVVQVPDVEKEPRSSLGDSLGDSLGEARRLELGASGSDLISACAQFGARSAFCVRTSFAGRANGLIFVARRRPAAALEEADGDLLTAAAEQVGIAFAHARMVGRLRRANEALRGAREAAEGANAAKSQFIACMTHELRTPLNAVIGFTSVLLDDAGEGAPRGLLGPPEPCPLGEERRDMLETIRSSGEALMAIINDILDFSKLEAQRVEFEARPFPVPSVVEDSLELVAAGAAKKGLALTWALERDVPQVAVGDAARLRQVLLNLLSNGVKFTPRNGSIAVRCRLAPGGPAAGPLDALEPLPRLPRSASGPLHPRRASAPASSRPASGRRLSAPADSPALLRALPPRGAPLYLRFDVGIGIPPERAGRLFQPFSQMDAGTTREYGGTGLGLAISKKIVEGMGGRLWCSPNAGGGTVFSFTVALRRASPADEAPEGGPASPLRGLRVAVASPYPEERCFFEVPPRPSPRAHEPGPSGASGQVELGREGAVCAAAPTLLLALAAGGRPDLLLLDAGQAGDLAALPAAPPAVLLGSSGPRSAAPAPGPLGRPVAPRPLRRAALFRLLRRALAAAGPGPGPGLRRPSLPLPGTTGARCRPPSSSRRRRPAPPPPSRRWTPCGAGPLPLPPHPRQRGEHEAGGAAAGALGLPPPATAGNGLEALAACRARPFDAVLMDVSMPVLDGIAATRRIRLEAPHQPRILALTANGSEEDRRGCLGAGMDDFLRKPIRLADLRSALAALPAPPRPGPGPL
eukprot:tig00000480_g1320.t1